MASGQCNNFSCTICHLSFTRNSRAPYILSCCEFSLCSECLSDLSESKSFVKCPQCESMTPRDFMAKSKMILKFLTTTCSSCSKFFEVVQNECKLCERFFCKKCFKAHGNCENASSKYSGLLQKICAENRNSFNSGVCKRINAIIEKLNQLKDHMYLETVRVRLAGKTIAVKNKLEQLNKSKLNDKEFSEYITLSKAYKDASLKISFEDNVRNKCCNELLKSIISQLNSVFTGSNSASKTSVKSLIAEDVELLSVSFPISQNHNPVQEVGKVGLPQSTSKVECMSQKNIKNAPDFIPLEFHSLKDFCQYFNRIELCSKFSLEGLEFIKLIDLHDRKSFAVLCKMATTYLINKYDIMNYDILSSWYIPTKTSENITVACYAPSADAFLCVTESQSFLFNRTISISNTGSITEIDTSKKILDIVGTKEDFFFLTDSSLLQNWISTFEFRSPSGASHLAASSRENVGCLRRENTSWRLYMFDFSKKESLCGTKTIAAANTPDINVMFFTTAVYSTFITTEKSNSQMKLSLINHEGDILASLKINGVYRNGIYVKDFILFVKKTDEIHFYK